MKYAQSFRTGPMNLHRTRRILTETGRNADKHDRPSGAEPRSRQEQKFRDGDSSKHLADADRLEEVGNAVARKERFPWGSEPGVPLVADGVPFKLAEPAIRAYGNAIVPQVAAEVIGAYMDIFDAAP